MTSESHPAPPDAGDLLPLILFAEDNQDIVLATRAYLRRRGYRVEIAVNGLELLRRAGEETPALVIMDVRMPELDGWEATRRLKADPALAHVPVIVLTALATPGDRERSLAAGADAYMTKPVNLKELLALIQNLLGDPA